MLIVFDKDGTLIRPKSGNRFVQSPEDQEVFPNVRNKIESLLKQGAKVAVASNQGGVTAGHKTIKSAMEEMQYCLNLLELTFGLICPDFSGESCWLISENNSCKLVPCQESSLSQYQHLSDFRKPGTGMLEAAEIWAKEEIYLYVGDRPEDKEAAQTINCSFQWAEEWRTNGPKI